MYLCFFKSPWGERHMRRSGWLHGLGVVSRCVTRRVSSLEIDRERETATRMHGIYVSGFSLLPTTWKKDERGGSLSLGVAEWWNSGSPSVQLSFEKCILCIALLPGHRASLTFQMPPPVHDNQRLNLRERNHYNSK